MLGLNLDRLETDELPLSPVCVLENSNSLGTYRLHLLLESAESVSILPSFMGFEDKAAPSEAAFIFSSANDAIVDSC